MTTAPRLHPTMPSHVGGHPIEEPVGDQLWCEANPGLFTALLAEKPPASDREGTRNYRDGIDVARDMCSDLCPRFEECLKTAIEGPPVAGFVAGTTETERDRHRAHLSVPSQPEPVDDWFVGLDRGGNKGRATNHAEIDAAIRRRPNAGAGTIAQHVDASTSTVKRRKRALAETPSAPSAPDGAPGAPSLTEHVDTYYLIRETP